MRAPGLNIPVASSVAVTDILILRRVLEKLDYRKRETENTLCCIAVCNYQECRPLCKLQQFAFAVLVIARSSNAIELLQLLLVWRGETVQ
jgi:hypothetical protein